MLGGHYFAEGKLLGGDGCSSAPLPEWEHDAATGVVRVGQDGDTSVELKLEPHWQLSVERPTLLVLRAASTPQGVIPTIELFIAPRCDTVQQQRALARLAARALEELEAPEKLFDTLASAKPAEQPLGTAGPDGSVALTRDTPRGRCELSLYFSEVVRGESFIVAAAAACPRSAAPGPMAETCETTYRTLLTPNPPSGAPHTAYQVTEGKGRPGFAMK